MYSSCICLYISVFVYVHLSCIERIINIIKSLQGFYTTFLGGGGGGGGGGGSLIASYRAYNLFITITYKNSVLMLILGESMEALDT